MASNSLLAFLRARGIATSVELQRQMGKSQASMSRMLREADAEILRLGSGRNARYAVPELIWGLPAQQPLYWNDHRRWGTLSFITGNRIHVASAKLDVTTQGELPWFLDNFRLEGFLGRAWARQLSFDANPDKWSLAQILYANCRFAFDPPGAISMGERSGELVAEVPADARGKEAAYDRYADNVAMTLPAGSSAGGEQPKFLAVEVANGDPSSMKRLIVKFSPPRGTPFGERWHDLLWAEHLALCVLHDSGIGSAQSRVIESARRTYLESVRFDREGPVNKIHTVPISAVHRAFVHGPRRNWAETCDALALQHRLPRADATTARVLLEYGRMIGNTDMHFGNLSVYAPDPSAGRFSLAPVYDMLPMRYRPNMHRGDIDYTPIELTRATPGHASAWSQARQLAVDFWRRLARLRMVSVQMRDIATRNQANLTA